jgi:hypothetical protein
MPIIDLSKYKVIYKDKVFRAIAIDYLDFPPAMTEKESFCMLPKKIGILFINENGQLSSLVADASLFQFVPVIN